MIRDWKMVAGVLAALGIGCLFTARRIEAQYASPVRVMNTSPASLVDHSNDILASVSAPAHRDDAAGREESLNLLSTAARTFEAGLALSFQSVELRSLAGGATAYVGIRYHEAGDRTKALDAIERALRYFNGIGANSELVQQQVLLTLQIYAVLLAERGDRNSALEQAGKAAGIFRTQAGIESAAVNGVLPKYWSWVGEMYEALANNGSATADLRSNDWRAAKDAYRRAEMEWQKTLAADRESEAALLERRVGTGDQALRSLTRNPFY